MLEALSAKLSYNVEKYSPLCIDGEAEMGRPHGQPPAALLVRLQQQLSAEGLCGKCLWQQKQPVEKGGGGQAEEAVPSQLQQQQEACRAGTAAYGPGVECDPNMPAK